MSDGDYYFSLFNFDSFKFKLYYFFIIIIIIKLYLFIFNLCRFFFFRNITRWRNRFRFGHRSNRFYRSAEPVSGLVEQVSFQRPAEPVSGPVQPVWSVGLRGIHLIIITLIKNLIKKTYWLNNNKKSTSSHHTRTHLKNLQ